jgi:hypothetical protein
MSPKEDWIKWRKQICKANGQLKLSSFSQVVQRSYRDKAARRRCTGTVREPRERTTNEDVTTDTGECVIAKSKV